MRATMSGFLFSLRGSYWPIRDELTVTITPSSAIECELRIQANDFLRFLRENNKHRKLESGFKVTSLTSPGESLIITDMMTLFIFKLNGIEIDGMFYPRQFYILEIIADREEERMVMRDRYDY